MACVLGLPALTLVAHAGAIYFSDAGGPKIWDNATADWSTTQGGNPAGTYDQLWGTGGNYDARFEGTAGTVNVSSTVSSVNSITFDVNGYTLTGGTIALANTGLITSSGTNTINSTITGNLTKQGAGILLLNNSLNNRTGYTDVQAGTLRVGGGNTFYMSTITVADNATLDLGSGSAQTAKVLNLNGGTLSSTGGAQWYLNTVTVSGGANTSTISTPTILYKSGGATFDVGSGATNGIDLDMTGPIQNVAGASNALVKSGAGVMRLTGVGTYTGGTVISEGTLSVSGGSNRLPTATPGLFNNPITVDNGATLTLADANSQSAHYLILDGGTLSSSGGGRWYLSNVVVPGGANTSTISATNCALYKAGGATFDVAAGSTVSGIDLDVTGTFGPGGGGSSKLVKTGAGVMRLSGVNTYTGGTVISEGTLSVSGGSNRLPTATPGLFNNPITVDNGATLTLADANSQSAHYLILNGGTLSSSGGGKWYLSNVTVSGDANTSTISATNVVLYLAGGANFNVGSGATSGIDLDVTGAIQNVVGASNALNKSGAGVMRLSGANTYTGLTTVSAGTLELTALNALGCNLRCAPAQTARVA